MRQHGNQFISSFARTLKRIRLALGRRLRCSPHARADIADVTLNYLSGIDKVDITDKFYLDMLAGSGAKRAVLVPDVALFLQLCESGLICGDIFEQADVTELEADDAFKRIIEQIEQKWIHIDDLAAAGIENQDSILSGFE